MSRAERSSSGALRVAVVGGGYAGFAAAVELASRGIQVLLFEAGPVFGGRARRVVYQGIDLDNGAHIMLGGYRETLRLMDLVSVPREALLRLPLQFVIKDRIAIHAAALPSPLHLLVGFLSARGLSWVERCAAIRFMLALRRADFRLPRDTTVAELLKTHAQGDTINEYFWYPLCIAALNTPPVQASAQCFLNVLHDGLARDKSDSDLLLPRTDFSRLFPDTAAAYLRSHGGQAMTLVPVARINAAPDGFRLSVRDQEFNADAVIVAVAPHQAQSLLAPISELAAMISDIARLVYEPICTVYLQYAEDVALPLPMLGLAGGLVQWVFDRQVLHGQHGMIAAVMSAASAHAALSSEVIASQVGAEIASHFPHLAKPTWSKVIMEKFATFACTPDLRRPPQQTPVRRLYLAGDYTAGAYPATLEGAVQSGVKCAQLLLAEVA
jgi:squalene-associated FAD-dependent desaturase